MLAYGGARGEVESPRIIINYLVRYSLIASGTKASGVTTRKVKVSVM